jgi:hypothetical protein
LLLKMLSLLPCPEPGLFCCCCCCCLLPPTLAGAAAPSYQRTNRQRVQWNAHEWSLKFIRILRSTLLKMGSSLFLFLSLFLSYMTSSKISNRNDEFLIDVEFLIEIKRHNCELKTFFF